MKKYSLIILLFILNGCAKKMYNYKTIVLKDGTAYYEPYSVRKKGEPSKDVLSTGDTLCGTNKWPYQVYYIHPKTNDTTFILK